MQSSTLCTLPRLWGSCKHGLVLLRTALLVPIVVFAPNSAVRLVAVLVGLSIPAFGPSQFSTVYGYSEPVVAAATRYGWWIGAAGVVAGFALTR